MKTFIVIGNGKAHKIELDVMGLLKKLWFTPLGQTIDVVDVKDTPNNTLQEVANG